MIAGAVAQWTSWRFVFVIGSALNTGMFAVPKSVAHRLQRVAYERGLGKHRIHAKLYAGKLVAALERQHPRDLFDV